MESKDDNRHRSDAVVKRKYSAVELLHLAAETWDKLSGRYMDDAQKADPITSEYMRVLAAEYADRAKQARELAGPKVADYV